MLDVAKSIKVQPSHRACSSRAGRAVDIARFAAATYGKTRLLSLGKETPSEVGSWIARESIAMGPLFVKIAQLVSARSDALDPELVKALSVVQDSVDSSDVKRPDIADYEIIGEEPIKAGSVASVWLAKRKSDGNLVVIKKLHDGVKKGFEIDLPMIIGVLKAATVAGLPGAENFYEIVNESKPMLLRETDLSLEAKTMETYRAHSPTCVVVPEVIESGPDYIVQQYVPSRRISDVKGPCKPLARRVMRVFVSSILEIGTVHGDPHPGNVGVLEDGRLVLYDWGAAVEVNRLRKGMTNLVQSLAVSDLEGFVDSLQAIGVLQAGGSDSYRVVRILEKLVNSPPEEFHVSLSQQPEFADSSGRRLVRFNSEAVYLLRALSMIEGICRSLDPDFSYESYWDPDIKKIVERAVGDPPSPQEIASKWLRVAVAGPETQRRTLDVVQQMNLELRDELTETRAMLKNAVLAAAALVTIATLM